MQLLLQAKVVLVFCGIARLVLQPFYFLLQLGVKLLSHVALHLELPHVLLQLFLLGSRGLKLLLTLLQALLTGC